MTRRSALAVAAGLLLAGCQDPYRGAGSLATPNERTIAPAHRSEPVVDAAARSFAALWTNWDWRTAATQQRRLARMAAPRLARQLRANAASARLDASLERDRPGTRGAVAIVKLVTTAGASSGLVVTREQTYTNGRADLGGQHYYVYRIAITRRAGAWEVTRWDPQP